MHTSTIERKEGGPPLLPLAALGLWWLATATWWGLAALPGGSAAPTWVNSVQAVCFGIGADGLLAPYGWGALIAGPLGMLTVLLVGWSGELRPALSWLHRPAGLALAIALAGPLVVEAGWIGWRVAQSGAPSATFTLDAAPGALPDGYPRLGRPAPAFALTDQLGRTTRLADFRGRVLMLTFAFGHCAQLCPTTVKQIESARREVGEPRPAVAVITLDAWRDTPATLSAIAERWGLEPQTVLLSGDVWAVNRALDAYEVARRRDERTGNIDHPPMVYVIDARGELAYAFLNPSTRWLIEAVRRVAGAS